MDLWIDLSYNSTQSLFVLPQNTNIDSNIYQPCAEIKDDKIPTLDLGLHSFNSDYNHFVYPEMNKKL